MIRVVRGLDVVVVGEDDDTKGSVCYVARQWWKQTESKKSNGRVVLCVLL